MSILIDNGNDWDHDGPCDIEGWFVDKDGYHRPVIRRVESEKVKKALGAKYPPFDVPGYFDMNGSLGKVELDSLYTYTLNDTNDDLSSPNLNSYLRKGLKNDKEKDKRIREIDYLINSSILKKDLNVFRGISMVRGKEHVEELINIKEGAIYYDHGFTSTSYSQEIAIGYGLEKSKDMIFLDIRLKKGTKGMPLFEWDKTSRKNEYEILLKRGQKFKVEEKKIAKNGDKTIVYIRLRSMVL